MAQDRVPTSKIERASKFLKTGIKIGGNYVKHYLSSNKDKARLEEQNARDIFEGFSELRGSALKIAQILSMDTVNFSQAFTEIMQKAQYSVPPMSAPLAVQAFTRSMGVSPEKVFDKFDAMAHKAASMGQVHVAYKNGKKLAVKIQYPGVADSIQSDIRMVKSVAPKIVNASLQELNPFFEEIEARLLEEADYRKELQNSLAFKEKCSCLPGIIFPEYYPELSSDKVITMEWLEGLHLREFLSTNPSAELRHQVAKHIWDFYEFQIHELKAVNADPHPGNFLFRDDGTVGVLDFGCTKVLSPELYQNYFTLAEPDLFEDTERAELVLLKLEILRESDTPDKRKHLLGLFRELITLIATPYHQGRFYFNDDAFYEKLNRVGTEISKLREIRGSKDFLFINRTYYGLYSLFQQLDVELETACKYRDFLKK
ncbi:MAG: AarF/UbiB family protein [Bacteroidia bacterium]|nr:AarF/UbiB family protein [Bacteroidia bacterium]MDW8158496.1 AarF/UbiB family protein [Bacteroidia bacterium]